MPLRLNASAHAWIILPACSRKSTPKRSTERPATSSSCLWRNAATRSLAAATKTAKGLGCAGYLGAKMRYFANGFWIPPKDRRLQKLEAEGRSGKEIAERLGTSRNAVVARSARLRGILFPSNIRREKKLRAQAAARLREKNRRNRTALFDMRAAMARGTRRDDAICAAV